MNEFFEHEHEHTFDSYCGAQICVICGDHKNLARCFCGFSRGRPGEGRRELEEMGEVCDDFPDDFFSEEDF